MVHSAGFHLVQDVWLSYRFLYLQPPALHNWISLSRDHVPRIGNQIFWVPELFLKFQ